MKTDNVKIIGLTGGIGSGKSTAAKIFCGFGAYLIDADKISHNILNKNTPAYTETVAEFGNGILDSDGLIDRKALAAIVFSDSAELDALNRITHKYIFDEMRRQIDACVSEHKFNIIVLDVPLLFADDFPFKCDKTVAVIADRETKLCRASERDGTDPEKIARRLDNQLSDEMLKERADYIVSNNADCSLDELKNQIFSIFSELK